MFLLLFVSQVLFNLPERNIRLVNVKLWPLILADTVAALRDIGFERDFFVVIDAFNLGLSEDIDSRCFQFTTLLQLSQASSFFEFLLTGLALRFFATGVCKSRSAFLKHLFLVLIHIDWIWSRWLRFRVRIDLASTQFSRVVRI